VHFIFPNFIAVLFSFPNSSRENGWGGWLAINQKTLVFPRESPKMQATGVKRQKLNGEPKACVADDGGFLHLGRQTEREEIPLPHELFLGQRHLCASPLFFNLSCLATCLTSQEELRDSRFRSSIHDSDFTVPGHVYLDDDQPAWIAKPVAKLRLRFVYSG
jgi:hypothetical protein